MMVVLSTEKFCPRRMSSLGCCNYIEKNLQCRLNLLEDSLTDVLFDLQDRTRRWL